MKIYLVVVSKSWKFGSSIPLNWKPWNPTCIIQLAFFRLHTFIQSTCASSFLKSMNMSLEKLMSPEFISLLCGLSISPWNANLCLITLDLIYCFLAMVILNQSIIHGNGVVFNRMCHSASEPSKSNCQYVHFLFYVTFVLTKLTKIANFIA